MSLLIITLADPSLNTQSAEKSFCAEAVETAIRRLYDPGMVAGGTANIITSHGNVGTVAYVSSAPNT